jgi:hypothetical protein
LYRIERERERERDFYGREREREILKWERKEGPEERNSSP